VYKTKYACLPSSAHMHVVAMSQFVFVMHMNR
jgi:hypothetical protein